MLCRGVLSVPVDSALSTPRISLDTPKTTTPCSNDGSTGGARWVYGRVGTRVGVWVGGYGEGYYPAAPPSQATLVLPGPNRCLARHVTVSLGHSGPCLGPPHNPAPAPVDTALPGQ